jgi:ABC-type bacteriocin/lantibiotic exporter with double-glycine peptidase domain
MQDRQETRAPKKKSLIGRLLGAAVRFQREDVDIEELDWGKMKAQLKWMYQFRKGYAGRINFLLGLSIFFTLLNVAYAAVYKSIAEFIWPRISGFVDYFQNALSTFEMRGFTQTVSWAYEMVRDGLMNGFKLPDGVGLPENLVQTGFKLSFQTIVYIIIAYVLYKIAMFFWSLFMQFFTTRLQMDCGLGIKRKVFAAILESDWMAVSEFHSGDLVNRIEGDANTISGFVLGTIPSLIVQIIMFITASGMLIYYDWKMMLIALMGIPMYLFVIKVKSKRTRDYSKRTRELSSRNGSFLNESMYNIMVIKSFQLVPTFLKRYKKLHDEMYEITYEKMRYGIVTGLVIGMVGRVVGWGITLFMLYRILEGELSIGVLAAYSILYGQVSAPVNAIMGFIMGSVEITASAERVMKLFDLPRDRTQMPESVIAFEEKATKQGGMGLRISNLMFEYIEGKNVINDANIDVAVGETVALVGPSGEGKTTMVRLMLGLLVPNSGTANLTTPLGETLPLSVETRRFFSYVPQGNTMFSGTIRDNMLLGDPDATDEMIIEALKRACAWSFIEAAPKQLDSKMGERGLGLSEGQAQRLAIARALLRGAPILLLDEATSALDIYTEKQVLDNIFTDGRIKTCVLTTHRPSVFQVCDKIYKIQKGMVSLVQTNRTETAVY